VCKHFYEPEPFVKPLEKIEMKKTLVAVAAMAAVTGAMANATIYGTIDQAYESTKLSAGANTTKTTKINGTWNGGSAIGFKAAEDLGSGMKAFAQYEFGVSVDQPDTSLENRYSFVGLSGDFGSVSIGRMYNFAFFNSIANDPFGHSGTGGYAVGYASAGGSQRQSNMIAYTAPSFVPGLGIQVAKAQGETASLNGAPKTNDSTAYGVTYASGALYAGITGETITAATAAAPTAAKTKNSTTTITYDLGMVKVGYSTGKTSTGADYNKAGAFSLTVPMGALTLAVSSGDRKAKTGAAAEVKTTVTQYGALYALSKRTNAYLQNGKASATATTTTVTAIGIKHDF
jgi:predicted porin